MKTFRTIFMMAMLMVLSLSAFQVAEEGLPMIQNPYADSAAGNDGLIQRNPAADTAPVEAVPMIQNPDTDPLADLNPVTGTPISNPDLLRLPPVFVPLARYPSAFRPSSGHSQAQWVFEMYVNNEESRPILMFYGEQPTVPVSRISSAIFGLEELRKQYGGIIIAGPDSMASRKEIWKAVRRNYDKDGLIDLFVDFRSSGTSLMVFTIDMANADEVDRYERDWLYSDDEASQEPCGARNVTYMGYMVGYFASHIVACHTNGKLRDVFPDSVIQVYLNPYLENPLVE